VQYVNILSVAAFDILSIETHCRQNVCSANLNSKEKQMKITTLSSGLQVVSTLAHQINFDDGTIVEPGSFVLNAKEVEKQIRTNVVSTCFEPDEAFIELLSNFQEFKPEVFIITSIIGLQAYGKYIDNLVSLVMTPETKRSAPSAKVAQANKFNK